MPMKSGARGAEEQEKYRREAMGAFAHEIRTPLTSVRMVLELARKDAESGEITLDGELAAMLNTSIDDLQRLADDLQESSRLERGRSRLNPGPCELGSAIAAAAELAGPRLRLEGAMPDSTEGPWDAPHLVRALAGLMDAVNRVGDGSGVVRLSTEHRTAQVMVALSSGHPGGEPRDIGADCGFAFFRSRQFVLSNGGELHWQRAERFFRVEVVLALP